MKKSFQVRPEMQTSGRVYVGGMAVTAAWAKPRHKSEKVFQIYRAWANETDITPLYTGEVSGSNARICRKRSKAAVAWLVG